MSSDHEEVQELLLTMAQAIEGQPNSRDNLYEGEALKNVIIGLRRKSIECPAVTRLLVALTAKIHTGTPPLPLHIEAAAAARQKASASSSSAWTHMKESAQSQITWPIGDIEQELSQLHGLQLDLIDFRSLRHNLRSHATHAHMAGAGAVLRPEVQAFLSAVLAQCARREEAEVM
jgi:hypothetical protein